ncbi:hypothetical protein [Natronobeatus ordinarius]|uniref:hypothetical protein n=1 Tax=Natronobeatus ordinarius TaxID=2963433 RepID=UPI0020CD50D0|nr:hypothetical protein [Natronobeatus ordinarius]
MSRLVESDECARCEATVDVSRRLCPDCARGTFQVVPSAPVEHEHRVDVGRGERRRPGPPEVVKAEV